MNTKITITLLAAASFLFPETIANAQTCGTSQVTYSGYTSGYLPKWNATTGCINNSTIFDNGEVGIGLTAPASRFHSAGQIRSGIPSGGLGGASATTGSLLFYNSSNTNTVNIQSGVTTTSYTMTLPATQGAASSVLTNNGSGGLDWAQLTVGSWLLAGNTLSGTLPASPAEFIGTLNAADWIIRTNNTEKMRVQSGGNVGIGTTTPSDKLGVAGGISIGAGYAGSTSAPTNGASIQGNVAIGATASPFSSSDKLIITSATAGDTHIRLQSATYTGGSSSLFYSSTSGEFRLTQNDGGPGMVFYTGYGTATEKMRIATSGNVGIGTTTPGQKLDVNGNVNVTGNFFATGTVNNTSGTFGPSDINLKQNFDSTFSGMAILHQLKPLTFDFKTGQYPRLHLPSGLQYGLIAQEVEQILPNLVMNDSLPSIKDSIGNIVSPSVQFKLLNYVELIPILLKGIKELDSTLIKKTQEQQQKIDSLQSKTNEQDSINASLQNQLITNNTLFQNQLNQLMTTINNCCNHPMQSPTENNQNTTKSMSINGFTPQGETRQIDVKLNDVQSIILEQNVPNPFAEQTTINYTLPDNAVKAQMLFYNTQGKLIQSVELVQKGKGQLNVFASDLSNGIYTYTLVVDGKIIDSKKMVRSK